MHILSMKLLFTLSLASTLILSVENAVTAEETTPIVDDFALLDHNGIFFQLTRQRDVPVIVLYVFTTGCPIVRQNMAEVQRLSQSFADKGVRFAAIDPAIDDDRVAVSKELANLNVSMPILLDPSQVISEGLQLTRTAEALIIRTKDLALLWRGPIDDRVGYGTQKDKASQSFLSDALDAILAGKKPTTSSLAVKGCAITYAQARASHIIDYAKDVAPIFLEKCQACHQTGGVAPWSMDSHKKVASRSAMMREVVRTRLMPPWDADPTHGRFAKDLSLSIAEQRTLIHWIEQGAKASVTDPLASKLPAKVDEWPLGKPDLIIDLPPQNIPANGTIPYRKFSFKVPLKEDTWVRAVDLRPSAQQWMHHAFAMDDAAEMDEEFGNDPRYQRLKEMLDGRPLPPEMQKRLDRSPRGLTTFFASYVPGLEAAPFPEGTGKLLKQNASLTFQLHYTTNGEAGTDKPRLGLYFAKDKPERLFKVTSAFNLRFSIPPETKSVPATAERGFTKPVTLFGFSPHMHFRGSSMRYTAVFPDGKEEIILSVPRYDLNWQRTYVLAEPRVIPSGTTIRVDGVFDNSAMNPANPDPSKAVRFGEQSWDEMFIGYILYAEVEKK